MKYLITTLIFLVMVPVRAQDTADIMVVRATYTWPDQLRGLASWNRPVHVDTQGSFAIVEVDSIGYQRLLAEGFHVEVDATLTNRYHMAPPPLPGQSTGITNFPCYPTVAETLALADDLIADHPNLVQWLDVGDSWEKVEDPEMGHDLRVMVLTNQNVVGDKPSLFVMSALHARELATSGVTIRFAQYLLDNYGLNGDATWLLDHHQVHLMFYANPDGRIMAEDLLSWRKNTNNNFCSNQSIRGVDLNRNFPFMWGLTGSCSSTSECSSTFRGPSPASESEVLAVRDYVRSVFPDQRGTGVTDPAPEDATGVFIDMHSYGGCVLWPYGFDGTLAGNDAALETLGRRFAWFNGYLPSKASQFFDTCGTTDDFAYGDLGIAAYTFEIGNQFMEPCSNFENTIWPDNLQALLYAAKQARTPYLNPTGPSVEDLTLSTNSGMVGDNITVTAALDDSRFNQNNGGVEPVDNIAQAQLYVDVPPWDLAAVPLALDAVDGSFDESREEVSHTLDTSSLGEGQHLLYLRGRDAADDWGQVSAGLVYLLSADSPRVTGNVSDVTTGLAVEATITMGPYVAVSNSSTGNYSLSVPSGGYTLSVTAPGYVDLNIGGLNLVLEQQLRKDLVMVPSCAQQVLDKFESTQGWMLTDEGDTNPVWSDSPLEAYANNADRSLVSGGLNLEDWKLPRLIFEHHYDLDPYGDDRITIEARVGDQPWQLLREYRGQSRDWQHEELDLPTGKEVQLRFRLISDGAFSGDGWLLEPPALLGATPQCVLGQLFEGWPDFSRVPHIIDHL